MFLKKKKEKTKLFWGTLNTHRKHSSDEQSTLEKTEHQELHYFYLLQQKGNKEAALQPAVQAQPHHLRETMFHGITDMWLITSKIQTQHPSNAFLCVGINTDDF